MAIAQAKFVGGTVDGSLREQGQDGYGRREKKGREVGSLQWWEARDKFKKASFCYFSLRVAAPSLCPLFLCQGEGVATRRLSLFVTASHPVKEIPCKPRVLSCMAFNVYEVIHMACLLW